MAGGYYSLRSKCTATYCDVGTWINLPWHSEFRRQLDLELMRLGFCTDVLAAVIRNHPNFEKHAWRKTRGGQGVSPDAQGEPVRYRILESQERGSETWRPVGVAAQGSDGTVLRFSPLRLFPPLEGRRLKDLGPVDFQQAGGLEVREFGSWRPGPILEGRLPGGGTVLDFLFHTFSDLPFEDQEEPDFNEP